MITPPDTRVSLVIRLRNAADVEAWETFSAVYSPLVYQLVRARGLQPADAADVAQEVFTRVAKSVQNWNPDPQLGTFRGWLARITRNLTIEFLRKQRRQATTGADAHLQSLLEQLPGDSSDVASQFDIERDRQVFRWAAEQVRGRFDETNWLAFWRTAVEAQPIAEVARELNITRAAVYVARSRVMSRLAQIVKRFDEEETQDFAID